MPHETQLLIAVNEAPAGASVMTRGPGFTGPLITGEGDLDLVCSSCKAIVVNGIRRGQIRSVVLQCECGKYCLAD